MLTKLLPDQISKFWPIIKYAVEESLPPNVIGDSPEKMNRVLSAMLCGKLDVWASYKQSDRKFEAILVTQILHDEASGERNLLLYCLYSYDKVDASSWRTGFEAVTKYAKARGCSGLIAYSANPHVVDLAKQYGADTSFTFISFKIV